MTNAFRTGWDKIFGKKKAPDPVFQYSFDANFLNLDSILSKYKILQKEPKVDMENGYKYDAAGRVCGHSEHNEFVIRLTYERIQCVICNVAGEINPSRMYTDQENEEWEAKQELFQKMKRSYALEPVPGEPAWTPQWATPDNTVQVPFNPGTQAIDMIQDEDEDDQDDD